MTADETSLLRIVGPPTFLRGRQYARQGAVLLTSDGGGGTLTGQVRGSGRDRYAATVHPVRDRHGALTGFHGVCSCPVGVNCKHTVALLLSSLTGPADEAAAPQASWAAPLDAVLRPGTTAITAAPSLGLQFELTRPAADRAGRVPPRRLALRPVVPGAAGNWVRSGISWSYLSYASHHTRPADSRHLRLLQELLALAGSGAAGYGYSSQPIFLDSFCTTRVWDLLTEAVASGLPLVPNSAKAGPVVLEPGPADVCLDLSRADRGLLARPEVLLQDRPLAAGGYLLLGRPAQVLAGWAFAGETVSGNRTPDARHATLRLARLRDPVDDGLRELLGHGAIRIPAPDEDRFRAEFYPRLRDRLTLRSLDGSVELPEPGPPQLRLTVEHLPGHRARVDWHWLRRLGATEQVEPLWAPAGTPNHRDEGERADAVSGVQALLNGYAGLFEPGPDGVRLSASALLEGLDTARFVGAGLPALRERPELIIAERGTAAEYRELDEAPRIAVTESPGTGGADSAGGTDWFDLAVTVSVGGEAVPFDQLFLALAARQEHLVLPSGSWFSLDREEYRRLAGLIAESRSLHDADADTLRVNRYHAGVWEELERMGVIGGQAAAWRETVRALSTAELTHREPPAGLLATLRPYQQAGFNWLAFLYEHGLGGILADEMGLGKTVQALALICHARSASTGGGPFLVVAPTSVVPNWAAEAQRFAPGLKVVAVTETEARRGSAVAGLADGADLVVTSYTLLRLEHDQYAAMPWSGLFLDEAQFVKNRSARGYECARTLTTPFKVAITGTPLENNLMELWSLLSIAAPGLFPRPDRFEQHYRTPIEKGGDAELLSQLQRRIRPLMLRRTKNLVAAELPAKQEQVIEVELNPRHRKLYQTYLQRERQKVLGLLGDFNRNRFEIFRSLTLLRQAALDLSLVDAKHARVPSTKLDLLMEQVTEVVAEGHRTLVFSQFTRFLAAARSRLEAAGVPYCHLDGSVRGAARARVLERFRAGTDPVFLISLRAGGFGLNLTEADHCILLDPWWNPAVEAQAVDRVHRIGQTRNVMVYRLVAKDTIEEKVMALKATKAALFSSVLDDTGATGAGLTAHDVRALLD